MENEKRGFLRSLTVWQRLIILGALLAGAIVCFVLTRGASGGPLIVNGDFSQLDDSGMPVGWYPDGYSDLSSVTFEVTAEEDGTHAAHIVSAAYRDARFAQTVAVEPNTLYRLHGCIRASANGGWGANLSVENIDSASQAVYETDGEWVEVSLYGKTVSDQRSVTVFARLGGYGSEAEGEAWFRDIALEPVGEVPNGYAAQFWGFEDMEWDTAPASNGSVWLIVCAGAYALLFCLALILFKKRKTDLTGGDPLPQLTAYLILGGILLLATIVRIAVMLIVPGYDVDINCFQSWAERMASVGPSKFYQNTFCDYPPGYLWVLGAVGLFGRLLGTGVTEFMVKLPPVYADLGVCALIYIAAEKRASRKKALALTGLYALNPLIVVTGAAWGQADALMVLMLTLTVFFALRDNWTAALPCYVGAVLIKPQALMFGPLGLLALIMFLVRTYREGQEKEALKATGLGLLAAGGLALLLILPFSVRQSPGWLIRLYQNTMGSYAYATVNSCNLYFLMGKNWASADAALGGSPLIPLLAWCLIFLPVAAVLIRRRIAKGPGGLSSREKLRLTIEGMAALGAALYLTLMTVTGRLTYGQLGACMVVFSVLLTCGQFLLSGHIRNLPIYGAISLLALFNTGAMMHERYLVPAAALLFLGYITQEKKDNRLLWLALGVTLSGFLNVGCVLNRNIRIGGTAAHLSAPLFGLVSDLAGLEYFSALLNIVLYALAVAYGADLSRQDQRGLRAVSPRVRHWTVALSAAAVYAVVAFTNLGSMKAPQTAWVSLASDEQITLDLRYSRSFHLAYFGGIHQYDSDFTVEVSSDGERWDTRYTAGMKIGDCFKWKYLSSYVEGVSPVDLYGRYIRITADHYDLTLYEVLPLDPYSHAPLTVSAVSGGPFGALVDEPGAAEPETAWTAETPGEQAILDLGEEKLFRLAYFGGAPTFDSNFTVETSFDLYSWTAYTARMGYDQPFQWQYLTDGEDGASPLLMYARYIRVTADHADLTLMEMQALDPGTDAVLPLSLVSDGSGAALIDEPGAAEPQTAWLPEPVSGPQTAILFLPQEKTVRLMYSAATERENTCITLETSADLVHWTAYNAYVRPNSSYTWHDLGVVAENGAWSVLSLDARFIRVTFDPEDVTLYEITACDPSTRAAIPLSVLPENASVANLMDEPDTMEGEPGWYNSTYFDEIYHARTGYELLHHMQNYEWTHPPMGKVFISWCIALFGMTPFGWRFAGAMAGVLMLPGLYLIGRLLTGKHGGGMAAMLLMAFDLMHFTQTRIATIDSFVVLFIIWMYYFMLKWFFLDYWKTPFWKTLACLFLSGLTLGFAIASKWTGVYAGLGLAVLFFWGLIRHILRYPKKGHADPVAQFDDQLRKWGRPLVTVGCCFIFFIFIPLTVYYCSYIPFFDHPGGGISVENVVEQAVGTALKDGNVGGMLGYHGQSGLGMDHPFYSPWYQWPVIAKPMWYASGSFDAAGYKTSITAMGNPAVWWTGAAALLLVLALWVRQHIAEDYTLALRPRNPDPRLGALLICFLAQYMPWMLVTRGTYIYHYFPAVPFIILCTALCLDRLEKKRRKAARIVRLSLLILAAALFIIFFPYASGISTPQSWMDACRWFRNWLWY